jgi:uncharacterized protein YidB (DUF937 family)
MDIMDEVKGLLDQDGVAGLAQKFKDSGLDEQVSSWISTGENLPVVGAQIKAALGSETVASVASKLGISEDEAADELAKAVPAAVDQATPTGQAAPAA